MSVITTRSADLVYAVCPKPECAARLRVKPKSARSTVTCANCGHKFVLDVPGERSRATRSPAPAQSLEFVDESPSTQHLSKYRRKSSSLGRIVVAGVAVGLLIGGIVGGLYAIRSKAPATPPSSTAVETPRPAAEKVGAFKTATSVAVSTPAEPKKADPNPPIVVPPETKPPLVPSRDEILDRVKKSTALIETKGGWGTGFVIAPDIMMTNAHVLGGGLLSEFTVSFVSLDDTAPPKLKPVLLYFDARRDLAILRVKTDRPPLEMTATGTELNDLEVAVVGNPKGDGEQAEINKVTIGRLSAPIRRNADSTYYELNAQAYFGNSGGPVVDLKTGKLVGVMQSMLGDGKAKSYCIPFGEAMRAINSLPVDATDEPKATKTAAARHALDYISHKLPELEKNASLAMDVQCTLLRIKAQGPKSRYRMEDGTLRSKPEILAMWSEVMQLLKEPLKEVLKTINGDLLPAIKASAEIPQTLKDLVRQRVEACESMRQLAQSSTETEDSFQKHMIKRREASIAKAKEFDTAYARFLDAIEAKAIGRK